MFKTVLSNGIEITQNFEWSITNRKLCIFMPNYHNEKFTKFSLKKIQTNVPKDDWVVIVGNDNTDDNFDEFANDNIYYFSMKRQDQSMRNGAFIRNFVIKNCQSELFFQKDGEVVIIGDFIESCMRLQSWRAGKIYVLNDDQTNDYMNAESVDSFINNPTCVIDNNFPETAEDVKSLILGSEGKPNMSTYYHYAYCTKTNVLKYLRGYDERFIHHGYEDSDMFCRLYALEYKLVPDYNICAVHLCHPRENINEEHTEYMRFFFANQEPYDGIRNHNKWGEGI